MRSSQVSRSSASLVTSYGFLRYFEVFGSLGASKTMASVEVEQKFGGSSIYILSKGMNSQRYEAEYITQTGSYGLKATIYPPFVSISGEVQKDALGMDTFTGRLQIGL
jgi:hypothetical protein